MRRQPRPSLVQKWLVACSAPSHYLNQYWHYIISTFGNKLQWKFESQFKHFPLMKKVWKCLENCGHFVSAWMCYHYWLILYSVLSDCNMVIFLSWQIPIAPPHKAPMGSFVSYSMNCLLSLLMLCWRQHNVLLTSNNNETIRVFAAISSYLMQAQLIVSHSILCDAITYPCMRYLLLAPKPPIIHDESK